MIECFEKKYQNQIDCRFVKDKYDKKIKKLELKESQLTSCLSEDKYINEKDIVDHLLLDSLSDSDFDNSKIYKYSQHSKSDIKNQDKSIKEFNNEEFDFNYKNYILNEPLNELIKKLQRQERELNRKEEIQENERTLREKIIQESLENEGNQEEIKNFKENKANDWKDEVSNEINAEFRKRCQARLKRNDNLNWIAYSERFQNLRLIKNMRTIKKLSKAWIECYQIQEQERYKYPSKPWLYYNPDGSTSIVAPVLRKIGQTTNKAREHNALKKDRPPYVTILCLVRDAAARLPDGVGTRADICSLLRCSQYLEKKSLDTAINNVVSGALDRLHYETDPCVKYDSEKRLWIYLHKNRKINDPLWCASQNDPPNTIENNSLKPEFFFSGNQPAYESDEDFDSNQLEKENDKKEEIKERESKSDFFESVNSTDKNQLMIGGYKHSRMYESSEFIYEKPPYKKQKI